MTKSHRNPNNPVDDMYNVWIDNFSNREQQLREETKAWAENLRQSTIDSSISTVSTRSNLLIEQKWLEYDIYSIDWFIHTLNQLLQEIEDIKAWISKKWLSKAWKETMNAAKTKLKQYEKQIKAKKSKLEKEIKQGNPQIFETDIARTKQLKSDIEAIRQDISLWQWWELSNRWSFLYNSPENARKANNQQDKLNNFEQKMKEEVKDGAILNIFNQHEQNAIDFYRRIAEWRYTQADYQLYETNSRILAPSFQRCWINSPILAPQVQPSWQIQISSIDQGTLKTWQWKQAVDYGSMELWEAFQTWWISWVIDKALNNCNNMTPWQRNAWKSIGVLSGYAIWIYWLYKFFTTKKINIWWKAWLTAAAILGSQIATWEWPLSLFNKLMTWWFTKEYFENKFWNAFWNAVSSVGNSWIESASTIAPAMYSMMIFNSNTKVWDIHSMTNNFKADPNTWRTFRWEAITKLKGKYGDNSIQHFSATFNDNFDEKKWKEWLSSIGITDSTADNKLIYELANNATMNEIIIEKFRTEHWVKETSDSLKKKEFREYIDNLKKTNQAINITTLEAHPERFEIDKDATYTERPEDIQFKEKLTTQVDSLSINEHKKSELKSAVQKFYDKRTIDTKPKLNDFYLSAENGIVVVNSYSWQKAKINIETWELVWFWNWIRFSDLSELLDVADLSNKILDSQKWKVAKDMPPFQYKIERKWICFNDATSIRQDIITRNNSWMDTRVLSTWRWWATSKIDTLYNHPWEYADYLSKRWIETNKLKINLSLYPTIKWLSESWITFINEQEVKQAEVRLNKVKEMRSMANGWTQWYKPFSIEWNKLVFSTSDTQNATKLYFPDQFPSNFAWKSQNLSNFPTILRNKDAFLNYMNDKKNWMRGSKLSQ